MKLPLKPLLAALIGLLLVSGLLAIKLTRPFAPFRYFTETNITPYTSTLVWTSHQPTQGCVVLLEPPLQFHCQPQPSYNHHITLPNLNAKRTHMAILISGFNFKTYTIDHRFIPDTLPPLPNPAYGKLIDPQGQPISGATITIDALGTKLSAQSSPTGTWSIDLGSDFSADTVLPLTIDYGAYHLSKYVLSLKEHQPSPDLVVAP